MDYLVDPEQNYMAEESTGTGEFASFCLIKFGKCPELGGCGIFIPIENA